MISSSYTTFSIAPIGDSTHDARLTVSQPPLNLVNGKCKRNDESKSAVEHHWPCHPSPSVLTELHAYLESLQKSPETGSKVIVVSSADPDVWISHLDLHIVSAQFPLENKKESMHLLHLLGGILRLLTVLPIIFIAEVDGLAVGGGVEFTVNLDMRFAGPRARFGVPEIAGRILYGGGLQAMTKLIGPGRATEVMLSSRAVTHKEAEKLGLVNRATDDAGHHREFVDALAMRIAVFPRGGIEGTKQGVRECLDGESSM